MRYSLLTIQDHYPDRARSLAAFYRETIEQTMLAEELGYDAHFVAEHHFHEYGVFPNPAVVLGYAAARTQRIRLGPAVAVLPFRNPLTVAEDYAMLDQLSGGRVLLGVGSGYLAHEYAGFGVPGAEKRERFDEALQIMVRAFSGERFSFAGKFHKLEDIAVNVPSLQQPHPPIYVAVLRREAAYHVGRQGHRLMNIPYASVDSFEEVGGLIEDFRRGRRDAGLATGPEDLLMAFHTHVAESDDAARQGAAEAFDLYVRTRLYAKQQSYDDILRSGLALFGSVETVAASLARLHRMGLRHVLFLHAFGMLDHAAVCRSIARAAHEVMPALRKSVQAEAVAG